MRLLTSTTLEQNEINLSSFPFQVQPLYVLDLQICYDARRFFVVSLLCFGGIYHI